MSSDFALTEAEIQRVKFFLHKFFWDNDDLQLVAIFSVV
jgi:hypothetical protein